MQETLFTQEQIQARVSQMGAQIAADYRDGNQLVVVAILKGSVIFAADLVRAINLPLEMDFIAASSYGYDSKSSGSVRITKELDLEIEGKDVLIVEDILDTGLTLDCLKRELAKANPASLDIAALLVKQGTQKVDIDCKYVGFDCPDGFIVGYGLDYAEHYRNLPYIGLLKTEVYQ